VSGTTRPVLALALNNRQRCPNHCIRSSVCPIRNLLIGQGSTLGRDLYHVLNIHVGSLSLSFSCSTLWNVHTL